MSKVCRMSCPMKCCCCCYYTSSLPFSMIPIVMRSMTRRFSHRAHFAHAERVAMQCSTLSCTLSTRNCWALQKNETRKKRNHNKYCTHFCSSVVDWIHVRAHRKPSRVAWTRELPTGRLVHIEFLWHFHCLVKFKNERKREKLWGKRVNNQQNFYICICIRMEWRETSEEPGHQTDRSL